MKAVRWCFFLLATMGRLDPVEAQSLAAAAERAREARTASNEAAPQYTNRDLPAARRAAATNTAAPSASSAATPQTVEPAPAPSPAVTPSGATGQLPADSSRAGQPASPHASWRLREIETRLGRLRTDAAALEARVEALNASASPAAEAAIQREKQEVVRALNRLRLNIASLEAARPRIGQRAR